MANMGYLRKSIAVTLALLTLTTPMMITGQLSDEFIQGKLDGERDAKGDPLWILAGVGCGVIGIGFAYFTSPSPPSHALIGKSSDYVLGYAEGYKNKARISNTMYASVGCILAVALSAALGAFEDVPK